MNLLMKKKKKKKEKGGRGGGWIKKNIIRLIYSLKTGHWAKAAKRIKPPKQRILHPKAPRQPKRK